MAKILTIISLASVCVFLVAADSFAQQRSGGQTGGRTTGGTGGNGGLGSAGLGNSGLSANSGLSMSGGIGSTNMMGQTGGQGGSSNLSAFQSGQAGQFGNNTGNPTFGANQGFIGGQNFGAATGGQGNRNRAGGQFGGMGGQSFGNLFGNNMGRQFGQFGMGNQNGFEAQRGGVRAVLVNRIETPLLEPAVVQSRLSERLTRLPGLANVSDRVQVSLSNGQAVVTGNFQSVAELDRFVRQLQLEPGVYRIDNRATISD